MKNFKPEFIYTILIFSIVVATVSINYYKHYSLDRSKIPDKVEQSKGFQRWLTNLKNKDFDFIDADQFRLVEENEIYNTKWMKVHSLDENGREEEFLKIIEDHKNLKKVVFSPSEKLFIDYRDETRGDYKPNQVHFYGLRDDKIIDARILDCSVRANCYFDRAYFLNNDVFFITEFSRNIHKRDQEAAICTPEENCIYTIKIHIVDLINNSRLVYESEPFNIIFSEIKPEL